MTYRLASKEDIAKIAKIEEEFFGKTIYAPPETREGLELFLDLGGEILMQICDTKINACIEMIHATRLQNADGKLNFLPDESALKQLYKHDFFKKLDPECYYIHGWISLNQMGKWLFKELAKRYGKNTLVGLVSQVNKQAIKAYTRFGTIAGEISNTYNKGERHFIVKYENNKKKFFTTPSFDHSKYLEKIHSLL